MDYNKLADLLYPDVHETVDQLLDRYPARDLPQGAEVTRLAPSPTGYFHLGQIYSGVIDNRIAYDSKGLFFMRLEDTDMKREVKDAGTIAYDMATYYGNDLSREGYQGDGRPEVGDYGPYVQTKRVGIYAVFAKELVRKGRAFPCFCGKSESKQDVLDRREQQLKSADDIEKHDPCRDLTYEDVEKNLKEGKKFALRLLSMGDPDKSFKFTDRIKGEREIRENGKDIVLIKNNGVPVYAFAHLVDDTLMHVTTVVRGEEWYPSVASHLELFRAMGLKPPKYAHTPVICVEDNGSKRKISKRKDPQADARFYIRVGYPKQSVIEYVYTLCNSNFEDWRRMNPTKSVLEFPFSVKKIPSNNPMFDFNKLNDISKDVVSRMTAEEIADAVLAWAQEYNAEFYNKIENKRDYLVELFTIDRGGKKPRKDIGKWSEVPEMYDYMFDVLPSDLNKFDFEEGVSKEDIKTICSQYIDMYADNDDKDTWFNKIKTLSDNNGYAGDMRAYRENPDAYKGSVATVSGIIRVALTTRRNTPDLYFISKLLGEQEVISRLKNIVDKI